MSNDSNSEYLETWFSPGTYRRPEKGKVLNHNLSLSIDTKTFFIPLLWNSKFIVNPPNTFP